MPPGAASSGQSLLQALLAAGFCIPRCKIPQTTRPGLGQCRNGVLSRSLRPRWPFPAIRGRPRRLTLIHLAAGQAENKPQEPQLQSVNILPIQSTSHLYNQSNMKHVHRPQPASPAGKIRLHRAAGCANRKAQPVGVERGSAKATALHLTSVFCKPPGREMIRTSWET